MSLFRKLCSAALLLCAVVVVFGAYVRLSDAGLGCPDWPGCYGQLVVPGEGASAYGEAIAHPERPLEAGKAWREMIHRYLASTLGLLIVSLALVSVWHRQAGVPRVLPWVLVGLVIFQGVLGMWTVTWLLKPAVVTAHLLGGMSILALLAWMRLSLREPAAVSQAAPMPKGLRRWALFSLVVLAVQIYLGGWTSTNYAALACPDLPTCQHQWWPDTDAREAFRFWRGLGTNYEYGVLDNRQRLTIHFVHRLGALLVTTVLLVLAVGLWRAQRRHLAVAVVAALGLQLLIGVSIVLEQLPLPLATAHNAGAALLLLTLVTVNHAAHTGPRSP